MGRSSSRLNRVPQAALRSDPGSLNWQSPGWRSLGWMVLLGTLGLAVPAQAQFNPQGRKKSKPATHATGPHRPSASPGPGTGAAKGAAPTAPHSKTSDGSSSSDEQKGQGPSVDALIARYTAIALQQPGAGFPLQRLAELYRQRDGNLANLVVDFEKRAAQPGADHWSALLALAGIQHQEGHTDQAIVSYQGAIAERPDEPVAHLALGQLLGARGDKTGARTELDRALSKTKTGADQEQILRQLVGLCLDLDDIPAAKKYQQRLVSQAQGSFYVQAELGRELLSRGKFPAAVTELQELVKAATGDNRVLAPALRDLGSALARLGQRKEALAVLQRALRVAGAEAGIRRDIYQSVVEVYRAEDRLPDLIRELEGQNVADELGLRILGSLYEETGQMEKALAVYQKALGRNSKDLETRIKVVQILQLQGEIDKAIQQYEALIQAAPRNPDFVFQLAEALIQRGDRAKALSQLTQLETRSNGDDQVLTALVNFYERLEEKGRSLDLLKRLAQMGTQDPQHLVILGERFWAEGDKTKAVQTWQRIKLVIADRPLAQLTLGEVYVNHGMTEEGLEAFREAVKLGKGQVRYKKALALALERAGAMSDAALAKRQYYQEARRLWEELIQTTASDPSLPREARQHLVALWALGGDLGARVGPLGKRFASNPPDLEAGRLLAEVEMRLKRWTNAERTLERLIQLAPGDIASLTQLERAWVQDRKLRPAIDILKKLTTADPKRAREYWQRMAQYADELYADDEAIEYSGRAVELSPDDADGHRRLGQMYRKRQDADHAILAFRKAISKNDRLFPAYLDLAELLLGKGELEEADHLLRRVVRGSPDDELVSQAARLSLQLNLGRGTLEILEKELLPVALGNPQKPLYRRLLVEVYGAWAFPLVYQSKSSDGAESAHALAELQRIGERAVKPLLDALGDERADQKRVAIELLSHIRNKGAGPALFAFATGPAEAELRVRAMLAVGTLRDPALLDKLGSWVSPPGNTGADAADPVVIAAAWSIAHTATREAREPLLAMLASESPELKAWGAIGLGLAHERSALPRLIATAQAGDSGSLPRAAAAFALGELGARTEERLLANLTEGTEPTLEALAVLALARSGSPAAPQAIAQALLSLEPDVQRAAVSAALVWSTGQYRAAPDPLPFPDGPQEVRSALNALRPAGYSPDERAQALIKLAPYLTVAAATAAQTSAERARIVAQALLGGDSAGGFFPLTLDLAKASPALREKAQVSASHIASQVVEPFIALSSHPSSALRILAVQYLATRPEPAAKAAIIGLLRDRDPSVARSALAAMAPQQSGESTRAIIELLRSAAAWPIRIQAAEALSRVVPGNEKASILAALQTAAKTDSYALVREAAVSALAHQDPEGSRAILETIALQDPEPRVRQAAQHALSGTTGEKH